MATRDGRGYPAVSRGWPLLPSEGNAMSQFATLPLQRFPVAETSDLDRARKATAQAYKDAHIETARPGGRLAMRLHATRLARLGLSAIRFGTTVDIDPGANEDFYVEHFVLRGRTEVEQDGNQISCARGRGVVVSPRRRLKLRVGGDCVLVGVKIDQQVVEDSLWELTGTHPTAPPRFEADVDLRSGQGAARHRLVRLLMDELERPDGLTASPLAAESLEQAYLASLLTAQPHSQLELFSARGLASCPEHVRRTEEYIRAHAHEPLTVKTLVSVAGVGPSTLYQAFKTHRGYTPMTFMRESRLERVRQDLLRPDAATTVTGRALHWGWLHLGRFSADYRRRFGELPSETLRRARRARGL